MNAKLFTSFVGLCCVVAWSHYESARHTHHARHGKLAALQQRHLHGEVKTSQELQYKSEAIKSATGGWILLDTFLKLFDGQ